MKLENRGQERHKKWERKTKEREEEGEGNEGKETVVLKYLNKQTFPNLIEAMNWQSKSTRSSQTWMSQRWQEKDT